jgi:hypothetical protein
MSLWPLLDPARAAALFVACAALITLWFLLRPRARRVIVPSLALFELDAKTHRDPRWRERLALLLQLVGAGLLCAALVREAAPEAAPVVVEGVTEAFVVDLSASMRAEGRMDAVRAALAAKPENAIVTAGDSPRLVAPPGLTKGRHDAVLAALTPGWGGAELLGAARLAESYGYRPIVLSDGPAPDGLAGQIVGEGGPDAAVVNVSASAGVGLPPEHNVAIILQNQGPERPARLSVETDEGPLGEETVTLPADGRLRRVYRVPPSSSAWVRAVISAEGDTLPENNTSAAALPPLGPAVVWLVTPGNRYLLGALKLLPGLTLKVFTPANAPSPGDDVDLVIYDRAAPKATLNAEVSAVYIDPPAGRGPMPLGERVEDPTFTTWDLTHPLFAGVSLRRLEVQAVSTVRAPAGARVLSATAAGPAWVVRDAAPRAQVLGFDLTRSDLPLTVAFPQLVYNWVIWARQGRAGEAPPPSVSAAEGLTVSPGLGAEVTRLDVPDAPTLTVPPGQRRVEGLAPGVYAVLDEAGERVQAVLFPEGELGRADVGPPVALGDAAPPAEASPTPRWLWLALAVVVVLALEQQVAPR